MNRTEMTFGKYQKEFFKIATDVRPVHRHRAR